MVNRPTGAGLGLLLDLLVGEPFTAPHPVALLGTALTQLEDRLWRDRRSAGMAHAAIGLALGAGAGALVRSTTFATCVAAAGRALGEAATQVADALEAGDLDAARSRLPALVGRDPAGLVAADICRAVIESVAENTVDAVVATGTWAAVAGAPGAFGHRAANTMDAMVGHHTDRHLRYGWAAARLDDVAAWVPARTTALLVVACRPRRARQVIHTVRRDARHHPSPNGGVAEAAFAAALGLQLGGTNRYGDQIEDRGTLGDGPAPRVADIHAAVRLARDVQLTLAGALLTVGAASGLARRGRR